MTKKKQIIMAICYDFDGTLSPGNMQEYGFIKMLGITPAAFWKDSNSLAATKKADSIMAYMWQMKQDAEKHNLPFTKESFKKYASTVELFPGVQEWFDQINAYAAKKNVKMEHYIISSGLKEMIEGTAIAHHFREIFASGFMYDENDNAVWPALAVNYTNKTQFLYRINKGCLDVSDNTSVNKHMSEEDKYMPFSHMIYIGDGDTDIPSMKTVKREGGHTIAVYQTGKEFKVKELLAPDRADVVALCDYTIGSHIDTFVKAVIDKVVADNKMEEIKKNLNQSLKQKQCKKIL